MRENRTSRYPAALAAAALLGLAAGCTPNVSERDITPATISDLANVAAQPDGPAMLIDARTPSAYRAGHIEGAINLGIADINIEARKLPNLVAAERIIVYGQNPGDTLATGLTLRMLEAGYSQTRLFRGGVDAWTDSGGDLVPSE